MGISAMIYKRKSTRSYTGEPVREEILEKIRAFASQLRLLYPDIPVIAEILPRERFQSILPWLPPQAVAVYTKEGAEALENVGFACQQLELYLQSLGLGVCWVGLARLKKPEPRQDSLRYGVMLCFGYPKEQPLREFISDFKRKPLEEISDRADARLEPARLAPSSVNSQPWYFTHEGDMLHVYCSLSGFLRKKALGDMNLIDIGIALGNLYVANPDTFRFYRVENTTSIKGYQYIGSFTL